MSQSHTWQPLSMCRQLGVDREILSIMKEHMLSGFSHSKCSEHLGLTLEINVTCNMLMLNVFTACV